MWICIWECWYDLGNNCMICLEILIFSTYLGMLEFLPEKKHMWTFWLTSWKEDQHLDKHLDRLMFLIFGWDGGKNAHMDITEVSFIVGLGSKVFIVGHATLKSTSRKMAKHEKRCMENQHMFIPFTFDTFNFCALDVVELLNRVQWVMYNNVMNPLSIGWF